MDQRRSRGVEGKAMESFRKISYFDCRRLHRNRLTPYRVPSRLTGVKSFQCPVGRIRTDFQTNVKEPTTPANPSPTINLNRFCKIFKGPSSFAYVAPTSGWSGRLGGDGRRVEGTPVWGGQGRKCPFPLRTFHRTAWVLFGSPDKFPQSIASPAPIPQSGHLPPPGPRHWRRSDGDRGGALPRLLRLPTPPGAPPRLRRWRRRGGGESRSANSRTNRAGDGLTLSGS